jgi:polar amino acid transport system substrate-binding protein
MRPAFIVAAASLVAACSPMQPKAPEAAIADLAPTGTLRAAINVGNAVLAARPAPPSDEPSGISVDLARELARRLGVPLQLIVYDATGKVVEAGKAGMWDIAFVALDAKRAAEINQSPPYLQIEGAINQTMASRRGREAGARYLREFVEEMKASGFVAKAIQRHKQPSAIVAPPGDAK